jgi:exonuclease V gamma subunit
VGDTVLTGTIERRHGAHLLFLRDGRADMTRLIRPFVTLCAAAAHDGTIADAIVVDADGVHHLACPPDPLAVLRDLVDLYHDADRAVPAYVPASAFAYEATYRTVRERLEADQPADRAHDDAHARALDAARAAWSNDDPNASSECDLPANRLLHAVSPVDAPDFAALARAVVRPVFDAMEGV